MSTSHKTPAAPAIAGGARAVVLKLCANGKRELIHNPDMSRLAAMIGARYFDCLRVMPFRCGATVNRGYVLIVDEEGASGPDIRGNAAASALYNPARPNEVAGDAILCKEGATDFECLTEEDVALIMKQHPVFGTPGWKIEDGVIVASE